jgi:hypothetical protein
MTQAYSTFFGEAPEEETPKSKDVDIVQRFADYDKDHCWQYDIRLKNMEDDLKAAHLTKEQAATLRVHDFTFRMVENKDDRRAMIDFIKRHEWLGNLSQFTTHWFAAYYRGHLAGVILMNMPNAFSKLVGEETKELERLVSRGACVSWSPKNLASAMLMWSINWMVQNTRYRVFTAYSDPTAKELGTIYQACNFYYIGQNSGTTTRYINPFTGKIVSDRFFRARSAYKKYAQMLGIQWQPNWNNDQSMLWANIPDDVEAQLREQSKKVQREAQPVTFPSKHKYVYIKGKTKKEDKELKRIFLERTKVYPYPKERGA